MPVNLRRITTITFVLSVLLLTAQGHSWGSGKPTSGRAYVASYCQQCDHSAKPDGKKYIAGVTCAASYNIPRGSRVWVKGLGTFTVTDRGIRIPRGCNAAIDLYKGKRCPPPLRCQWSKRGVPWRLVK